MHLILYFSFEPAAARENIANTVVSAETSTGNFKTCRRIVSFSLLQVQPSVVIPKPFQQILFPCFRHFHFYLRKYCLFCRFLLIQYLLYPCFYPRQTIRNWRDAVSLEVRHPKFYRTGWPLPEHCRLWKAKSRAIPDFRRICTNSHLKRWGISPCPTVFGRSSEPFVPAF